MRFKLFGGLDCPDFLLAQLSVVASLPAEIVAKCTDNAIAVILAPPQCPADAAVANDEFLLQCAADVTAWRAAEGAGRSGPATSPLLAAVEAATAVHSIVESAVRFRVPADTCANELSMLGLAAEVADAITASLTACAAPLYKAQLRAMPMLAGIAAPSASIWAADDGSGALVRLRFSTSRQHATTAPAAGDTVLEMTALQSQALLAELVRARRELGEENRTSDA